MYDNCVVYMHVTLKHLSCGGLIGQKIIQFWMTSFSSTIQFLHISSLWQYIVPSRSSGKQTWSVLIVFLIVDWNPLYDRIRTESLTLWYWAYGLYNIFRSQLICSSQVFYVSVKNSIFVCFYIGHVLCMLVILHC